MSEVIITDETEFFLSSLRKLKGDGAIKFDREVADKIGMDKANLSFILNGKRNIPKTKFEVFLKEFKLKFAKSQANGKDLELSDSQVMMVPLVPKYAYAGYLRGYGDAEYIGELPKIPFPVDRERKGTYRAFEVSGDSMDVDARKYYKAGDILLGREIARHHWRDKLHINKWSFVIVHKVEGILIKDIIKHDVQKGVITLHSLNTFYDDFDVKLDDVAQIYNVIKVVRDE